MKIILALLIVIPGCFGVQKGTPENNDRGIKCVNVYREFPLMNNDGKLVERTKYDARFYYFDSLVVCQYYTYHAVMNTKEDMENPDFKYVYKSFVYSPDKKYAMLCDSTDLSSAKQVTKDSITGTEWAFTIDFSFLFQKSESKLISRKKDGDKLEELYSFVSKEDEGNKGTFKVVFSQTAFSDVPYSLSPSLDSAYGMKLISVDMLNFARDIIRKDTIHVDEVNVPYRLQECNVNNREELMKLLVKAGEFVK